MDDACYELIADQVDLEAWRTFQKRLLYGFRGFPESWNLDAERRERLLLKVQWVHFNPDQVTGIADKRARSWAFMRSFLSAAFQRKFGFLRSRLEPSQRDAWDAGFADYETLLYLSSMTETMQLEWLSSFDGRIRYGAAKRVKVIKNKGLGFTSDILGVDVTMDWEQIRARYRFLLKKHHPDAGGDAASVQAVIEAFKQLEARR